MDLNDYLSLAKKAALAAGKIIAKNQGQSIKTQSKQGGENIASQVVTEIDLKAEQAILKTLTPTFEEIGLLAEETASTNTSRFEKDYFWCIDPLDGTLCYSRDEDGYSTSIALVAKDGTPMIGVVYNPRYDSLYWAVKGKGAWKNDLPFKVKKTSEDLTLLYDQSYLKYPLYEQQIAKLKEDIKLMGFNSLNIFHLGGAVMNGITTIEMAPAVYYKFPKKAEGGGSLWDFAASSIIQSEAGGFNSDYFRQPLDLNRKGSTFMNHKGIIYASDESLLEIIPKI